MVEPLVFIIHTLEVLEVFQWNKNCLKEEVCLFWRQPFLKNPAIFLCVIILKNNNKSQALTMS